jgi:serine/threonine protein kinase/uncharacterized protein HemY
MNEDPTLQLGDLTAASPSQTPGHTAPIAAWGSFKLLARVGAGGFGEVYRAWDPVLQREVALKLLLPGSLGTTGGGPLSDDDYDAVLREARALASVRHPNIVAIYGVDRHEGRVGLWTDFIRGKTLSAIVGDQGPFGYREAALIGLDIARALAAVHRAGLLHRDIKPENVMREEGGRILLMDFGLSTLPHRSGELSGTLNYMAHELFHGAPSTVASDIYAAGILLYYLVTATFPVRLSGLTIAEASQASLRRTPLIDHRSDLPESFIRVVNRAIDLDPARRFHSAGEMAEALAEAIGVHSAGPAPEPATPTRPAAKPEKQRHPLRGLLITAIVLFFVFGERIPFIGRLFDHDSKTPAADNSPAQSSYETYTQAQALLLKSYKYANIDAAIAKFQQIPPADPNYALAQAGLGSAHFIQYRNAQDPKLLSQAVAETNKALQLDSKTAPAYVTLARIAAAQGHNDEAMQMAKEAMSIDPTNADAFRAQADVLEAEGRHSDAIAAMQKAADLAPDDWRFPMNLGVYFVAAGKLQQAANEFKKSAELADDNAIAYYNLGHVEAQLNQLDQAQADLQHSLAIEPHARTYEVLSWLDAQLGKFPDAIAAAQKATEMEPSSYLAWDTLGDAYRRIPIKAQSARDATLQAIHFAEDIRKSSPRDAELLATLARLYARVSDRDHASSAMRQAMLLAPSDPKVDYEAGVASELMGDRTQAIALIASSIGVGYSQAEVKRNPELAALCADPNFQQRLRQQSIPSDNSLDNGKKKD